MQHRTARVRSGRLQADQLRSGNPSSAQVSSGQLCTTKSTKLSSAQISPGRVNSASVSSARVSAGQLRSAQLQSAQLQTASLRPGQHRSLRKIPLRSAHLRFNRDIPIPHVWRIRPAGPPYPCSAPRSEGLPPLVVLPPSRVELCCVSSVTIFFFPLVYTIAPMAHASGFVLVLRTTARIIIYMIR